MTDDSWFDQTREYREEVLYPQLFGAVSDERHTLSAETFVELFGQASVDPHWLHTAVLECPPHTGRDSWLYVSSGLSNDWWSDKPDPGGTSGIGNEYVLELPRRADWAVHCLAQVCAIQILLACERLPGRRILAPLDRLPVRLAGLVGGVTELTHLFVIPSPALPPTSQLRSGTFRWHHVVGITDKEALLASKGSPRVLLERLEALGLASVTDPARASIV